MGEIRTWTDREVYLSVLKKEISVLQTKYKPHEEGTGHFNTTISVLETEVEVLGRYYKPETEGTGHFNTAISVLQRRIEEIRNGTTA